MEMIEGEDKRFTCSVDENIELSEGFCPLLTLLTSLLTLLTSYFLEVLTGPLIIITCRVEEDRVEVFALQFSHH